MDCSPNRFELNILTGHDNPPSKGDRSSAGVYGDLAELVMRGSILCQKCTRKRTSRLCPRCSYDACFIKLDFKGETYRVFHDKSGKSLSFREAFQTLANINLEIENKSFDPGNWVDSALSEKKFSRQYEVWLDQKEREASAGRFSHATLRLYRIYNNYFDSLHNLDVREIRLKHLQGFLDSVRSAEEGSRALSNKYKKNMMDCLKTFFKWLVRWGEIEKLPIFPEVRLDTGETSRAISYEAQMQHIERIPSEHREIFYFMRECGLRVSETCALQVRDFDLPSGRAIIQRTYSEARLVETTKGKNKSWVPLSDPAMEIASRRVLSRFGAEFVFINPRTGEGYKPNYLRRIWKKYSGSDLTLYEGMRHSTISDWSRTANAFQVKDLARHSDIRISQRYVHNAMTDLRDVVNRRVIRLNPSDRRQIDTQKTNDGGR